MIRRGPNDTYDDIVQYRKAQYVLNKMIRDSKSETHFDNKQSLQRFLNERVNRELETLGNPFFCKVNDDPITGLGHIDIEKRDNNEGGVILGRN
ncbi:MAG: hypothetical protein NC548_28440 [Lachnospiraceae bacterium]|nr:hypothetical protein [Lachnospiraceae bacterium]MCM1232021.1 hypothetical protein [Ruminococcus flavefaciens]